MTATFRTVDRSTPYFLPKSIEDWLPRRSPCPLRGGNRREARPRSVEDVIRRSRLHALRSRDAPGTALLRVRHRSQVEPEDRDGNLRRHRLPLYIREQPSGSRHHSLLPAVFLEQIPEYFVHILEVARDGVEERAKRESGRNEGQGKHRLLQRVRNRAADLLGVHGVQF